MGRCEKQKIREEMLNKNNKKISKQIDKTKK